jgi:hypothetical protein
VAPEHWTSENGQPLLVDSFEGPAAEWRPIYLEGVGSGGRHTAAGGRLTVQATEPDTIYGLWHPTPISGHFYAEAQFEEDDACGLAVIREKNGMPDPANFTSIGVRRNSEGKVVVYARDRQNGIDSVFDNTGKLGGDRYETVLDNQYSVPFESTNKKIRIFRDGPAGFFHFYYAVRTQIRGKWVEGWMELAPSRDWGEPDQRYYVALYARSAEEAPATAAFNGVRVMAKPTRDRDDTVTGFEAVRREYNWSGFFGEAVVVSFGPEFAYRDQDRKFVFWSEMNYIPAWHMNNQLLYSYEFVETWGGGVKGCHEPMSDRLLRWSKVDIVEDNDVRKVVRWRYVLCNPDYRVPRDDVGSQLPEVEETWTIYPDGTAVRHIIYWPKLDSDHRHCNELMELLPIGGSLTNPVDHLSTPALSVMTLDGDVDQYHPPRDFNQATNEWEDVIMVAHFKEAPDAFCAFSNRREVREAHSSTNIHFDLSWHYRDYRLCHWPVGKEPFRAPDGIKTHGTWKSQVSHTCLMGAGTCEGREWDDHYRLDERGQKYREWVMLAGLSDPGDPEGVRARTATWLDPGTVIAVGASCAFERIDHSRREIVLRSAAPGSECRFAVEPGAVNVVNPAFRIRNWGERPIAVVMNGRPLTAGKGFMAAAVGTDVIVWVRAQLDSRSTLAILPG